MLDTKISFGTRARILQKAKLDEFTKQYPNVREGINQAMQQLERNGSKDTFSLSLVTPDSAAKYKLEPAYYLRSVRSGTDNIKRTFTELTDQRLKILNDNIATVKNFITRTIYNGLG